MVIHLLCHVRQFVLTGEQTRSFCKIFFAFPGILINGIVEIQDNPRYHYNYQDTGTGTCVNNRYKLIVEFIFETRLMMRSWIHRHFQQKKVLELILVSFVRCLSSS